MRICMDGFSLTYLKGTGSYSYAFGLLSKLFEMFPQPRYEFVWNSDLVIPMWQKYKNIEYLNIEINRKYNDYRLLTDHLMNCNTDLYFSPNNGLSIPREKPCSYIMAVHDLAPVSAGNLTDEKYYHKFMSVFPEAVNNADTIIAVSNFIKNELIKYFNLPDNKIEVVYPGCSDIFKPMDLQKVKALLKAKYHIGEDYIFYAGSIHPRKNLEALFNAFYLLVKEINHIKLVIAGNYSGKRTEYYLTLKKMAEDYELQDQVIFLGTVEYTDMPYLYNGAGCSVNLSDYEGFPTTVMEACACGTPVICLNNTSFQEMPFPTAVYLERPDPYLLRDTLLHIIHNNQANRRIDRSDQLIPVYGWEASAKKMIRIIETAVYGSPDCRI